MKPVVFTAMSRGEPPTVLKELVRPPFESYISIDDEVVTKMCPDEFVVTPFGEETPVISKRKLRSKFCPRAAIRFT